MMMHVLVAYGSKRGGTAGLAAMIAEELTSRGVEADVRAPAAVRTVEPYTAVIVAGALYNNRWHRDAGRFVQRHARALRMLPVWLVSSGPLDDTARWGTLPPVAQVAKLAAMVGARGCVTFGGRLEPDAKGFPASAMARKLAGDWRDSEQVREFALVVTAELAAATPGAA